MNRPWQIIGVVLLLMSAPMRAPGALVDYADLIGYNRLMQELAAAGTPMPDGTGIKVAQVEAFATDSTRFTPNLTNSLFTDKTFSVVSSGSTESSGHAQNVAVIFYGDRAVDPTSIAPGITDIVLYSADGWMGNDYLKRTLSTLPPDAMTGIRVTNHSWVGELTNAGGMPDNNAMRLTLRKMDYVVERYESIQVVGLNNFSIRKPLFAQAANVIAVGRADGLHSWGSDDIGGAYAAGRTKPDLVVPETATSYATPVVSAAAAMLLQVSAENPQLSGQYLNSSLGRNVEYSETSEVIRAVLMAGADRRAVTTYPNNATYVVNTENGLNNRYGAGILNVHNSYHILMGGERNSVEDGGPPLIPTYGFDYDLDFGGRGGDNGMATYRFHAVDSLIDFHASLVWNLQIPSLQTHAEQFRNLSLSLWDVTDSLPGSMVAMSDSSVDNTENLWLQLERGHQYEMRVTLGEGQSTFSNGDYALAWRIDPIYVEGDVDLDGDVDIWDFLTLQEHFGLLEGATRKQGDLDGDGKVDVADFVILRGQFHGPFVATGLEGTGLTEWEVPWVSGGTSVAVVPTPTALGIVAAGLLSTLGGRLRRHRRHSAP